MRRILYLTTILILQTLVGCAQKNESKGGKITNDFFYGTWTIDGSNSDTFTFTKEKQAFAKMKSEGTQAYGPETTFTYELALDKKPATIEFTCKTNCPNGFHKKMVIQIEIISSTQVLFILSDKRGSIIRTRLTKK